MLRKPIIYVEIDPDVFNGGCANIVQNQADRWLTMKVVETKGGKGSDSDTSVRSMSRGKFIAYLAFVLPALWALLAACGGGGGGGRKDHP